MPGLSQERVELARLIKKISGDNNPFFEVGSEISSPARDQRQSVAQRQPFALELFLESLAEGLSTQQMEQIPKLSDAALSLFPKSSSRSKELTATHREILTLLDEELINFEDIQAIHCLDHPLLSATARQRILRGDSSRSSEIKSVKDVNDTIEWAYFKKLRNELSERFFAVHPKGTPAHDALQQYFADFEMCLIQSNCHDLGPWEAFKRDVRVLRSVMLQHKCYEIISYPELTQKIKQLDAQKQAQKVKPSVLTIKQEEQSLGYQLIARFCDQKAAKRSEAMAVIKGLNHQQKIDFINKYYQVFEAKSCLMVDLAAGREEIAEAIEVIAGLLETHLDHAGQADNWEEVLRYALTPHDPQFRNGFDVPVATIEALNPTKKAIADATIAATDGQMTNAIFKEKKQGGANGAGEYGGVYLSYYIDSNGSLKTQMSLIKQATDDDQPNHCDNMREFFGGYYGQILAVQHSAPISVMLKPGGQRGQPDAVYLMSTYFDDFIDAHTAAHHTAIEMELIDKVPERAKGKNAGQYINKPIPGFGDNRHFQKGIMAYVEKHGISIESFVKAILTPVILANKQVHVQNIGIATVGIREDGSPIRAWVSLDFGGTLRRDFNTDDLSCNIEMPGEVSDEIDFFKGKGNKHGACYTAAYPMEFYLDKKFIVEARKIHNQQKQGLLSGDVKADVRACLDQMVKHWGEPAVLEHFANQCRTPSWSVPTFESIDEFVVFYLQKYQKRLDSLETFALELELGGILLKPNSMSTRDELSCFIATYPKYKLDCGPYSEKSGALMELALQSKTLRTVLKKLPKAQRQAFTRQLIERWPKEYIKHLPKDVSIADIQSHIDAYNNTRIRTGRKDSDAMAAIKKIIEDTARANSDGNAPLSDEIKESLLATIRGFYWRLEKGKDTYQTCLKIFNTICGTKNEKIFIDYMTQWPKDLSKLKPFVSKKAESLEKAPPSESAPLSSSFSRKASEDSVKNPLASDFTTGGVYESRLSFSDSPVSVINS